MATKHTDICLQKAEDDEPIFVLRAKDMTAPVVVRLWADMLAVRDPHNWKVAEARELAAKMEAWPTRKMPD